MSFENRLTDWKDQFLKENVQNVDDSGNFLSSESVVIFSGPAQITGGTTAGDLIPIGLVQNASVSQGKQVQQIYEIGSRKPIMVPGRTQVQLQLSRVLFDGPSLSKVVYTRMNGESLETPNVEESSSAGNDGNELENPTDPFLATSPNDPDQQGDFWINLASNVFNKPLGLGFALYDMEKESYGGFYLENCYARNHNFGISAQQTVLAESMSFLCTQLRPLSSKFIGEGA